ncbi:MAG: lipid-binding SYLF domain-containing protein [Hyphomicrobiales bacterium]
MHVSVSMAAAAAWLALTTGAVTAADQSEADIIVDQSQRLVEEMMISGDRQVPEGLMRQAAGIALIPAMLKGGLIIGASYGKGVVLQLAPEGWTGPAFISISGGSLGLQIGGQSVDLILVIVGQDAANAFMRNEFKLGADACLAAGPAGTRVSTATDIAFRGGIYSYSRASGLFAGISIEGAVVSSLEDLNRAYYKDTGSTAVILAGKVRPSESGQRLISVLNNVK